MGAINHSCWVLWVHFIQYQQNKSSLVLFDTNQREMGKKTGLFDINQAYATGNRINVRI